MGICKVLLLARGTQERVDSSFANSWFPDSGELQQPDSVNDNDSDLQPLNPGYK